MNNGWVCLHRSLLEWEWYDDINVCRLFIHCLLRANHKEKSWKGKTIKRGQFWTSLDTLAAETKLSKKQIRVALSKLEKTGEVANQGHATGRMITVVEYDSYQDKGTPEGTPEGTQGADQGHAKGTQGAANNNDNNDNNDNKKPKIPLDPVDFSVFGLPDNQIEEIKRIRKKNKGGAITQRVANKIAEEIQAGQKMGWTIEDLLTEWEDRSWKSFRSDWIKPKAGQYSAVTQHNIDVLSNLDLD